MEALEAGFGGGGVIAEQMPGAAPDHRRIALRSAGRAWAAGILPDGSAQELPPLRPRGAPAGGLAAMTARRRRPGA